VSEAVHDAKTDALTELVDELQGSPLLIAYEFHHDLERIRKALGNVPAINGQTKQAETLELVGAWNRGELPVLAGHPQAMGHGLNLQQAGHHVCWYSLTWDYELYDQLVRRVYRQGQASRVVVHRILARQTVDLDVAAALRQKGSCQAGLFDALRARSKKRS
jgi:SNF2 family DNA or RNA helicase